MDPLEPAALVIWVVVVVCVVFHIVTHNRRYTCRECGFRFDVVESNLVCPHCVSEDIEPSHYPLRPSLEGRPAIGGPFMNGGAEDSTLKIDLEPGENSFSDIPAVSGRDDTGSGFLASA